MNDRIDDVPVRASWLLRLVVAPTLVRILKRVNLGS